MTDPRAKYEDALATFARPGKRWDNKGQLTYWGKAAGLTADEIIADARAVGVRDRDADIRRGWADAKTRDAANMANYVPREKKPKPPQHAAHVRNLIDAGGGMGRSDAVRELSPCSDWIGKPPTVQTAMFLRAAFRPAEVLHVFRADAPTAGKIGVNLRTAADWVQAVERGEPLPGDLIVPNPFTGDQGTTTAGKQSLIAQGCLASFQYLILEFDDLPLARQCAFWRGFVLTSNLAPSLVALTFSGNRSIHGLVHVGCGTLADWQAVRQSMRGLFASDPDATLRADDQAMQPRTGTRLPGVRRFDNHRAQTLLYLNPRARAGTMWRECVPMPPPINPNGKPSETRWARRCADCPARVKTACRVFFDAYWPDRSHGGEGCSSPVDEAAEAWYAAGWRAAGQHVGL